PGASTSPADGASATAGQARRNLPRQDRRTGACADVAVRSPPGTPPTARRAPPAAPATSGCRTQTTTADPGQEPSPLQGRPLRWESAVPRSFGDGERYLIVRLLVRRFAAAIVAERCLHSPWSSAKNAVGTRDR